MSKVTPSTYNLSKIKITFLTNLSNDLEIITLTPHCGSAFGYRAFNGIVIEKYGLRWIDGIIVTNDTAFCGRPIDG